MSGTPVAGGIFLPERRGPDGVLLAFQGFFTLATGWLLFTLAGGANAWGESTSLLETLLGTGLALALFAVCARGAIGAAWRLIDRRPQVRFDADGIRFHPSLGPELVRWEDISGVRHAPRRKPRRGTVHLVEIDLLEPYRGWTAPFGSTFTEIDFGERADAAEECVRVIERGRQTARERG